MLILVVLPFDMFYHAGKAINHMTSSEVCTKVAEKGKHVTFRAYLACRARDLMRGRPQSSRKNAYHLRT